MVLRIGRQPLSTHSLSLFIPPCRGVRGMISWSGDWLHLVFFTCTLFISYYLVLPLRHFLGSVYGVLKCLNGCLSSYGQQLIMGYSPLTTLLRKVSFWLISVACVVAMGNQWTTFFFIVSSLMPYGVKFLQCSGFNGNAKVSEIFFLYLEKLVWKASFNHLEHGLGMFNVVSLART